LNENQLAADCVAEQIAELVASKTGVHRLAVIEAHLDFVPCHIAPVDPSCRRGRCARRPAYCPLFQSSERVIQLATSSDPGNHEHGSSKPLEVCVPRFRAGGLRPRPGM